VALAEARKARGLTQAQAASAAGVGRVYLAKMEAGLTVTLLERALRVLRRLGAQVVVELSDASASDRPAAPDVAARSAVSERELS
jgi:transcriptional regulator with XRE-family HTH domain